MSVDVVTSVALGVSDEVASNLAIKLPQEQSGEFAPWYHGPGSGAALFVNFGGISLSFGSEISAVFSSPVRSKVT